MHKDAKIYIAGHTGMVGSAILRCLREKGYTNFVLRSLDELDLLRQSDVETFFEQQRPDYVIDCAARVGGILANNIYRAQFIYENLTIQNNIIHCAYASGVKKLLFLGSSCIYPKMAGQPLKEEYLLTGELEPTNEPYAIAKIAGIKMCESYYRQYGCNFFSVMPTNLYGPHDNYDLETSHVLPAMIRKMHLGKCLQSNDWPALRTDLGRRPIEGTDGAAGQERILDILAKYGIGYDDEALGKGANATHNRPLPGECPGQPSGSYPCKVTLWGTGSARREFMHVDDMAAACIFVLEHAAAADMLSSSGSAAETSFLNIGTGEDITIRELAEKIKCIIGFTGALVWDAAKPDGTPQKLLDVTRLHRAGFQHRYGLEDGIRMVYEYYTGTAVSEAAQAHSP